MTDERYPIAFGPYELLGRLGHGAAGSAHLARPGPSTSGVPTPVVIKRLHARVARKADFIRRFRHEAEIAVLVDSPHVARVFDVGSVGGRMYIALEYVPGWTLGKLLGVIHNRERPPPEAVAADVARQILRGLAALHEARDRRGVPLNVVHRDLSPKNLMVGDDGRVRIIDLGLGKSRAQDWQTEAGRVMGSPGYMPPEQITGQPVDQRADVFAAAVVIHELFTATRYIEVGEPLDMLREALSRPYTPIRAIRPDVPEGLDALLSAALDDEPERRPANARAVLASFEHIYGSEGEQTAAVAEWVRSTLPAEQSGRRTEVRRLLATPELRLEDAPEIQPTEVWVARSGVTHGGTEMTPVPDAARSTTSGSRSPRSGVEVEIIAARRPIEWLRLGLALLVGVILGASGMRIVDGTGLDAPLVEATRSHPAPEPGPPLPLTLRAAPKPSVVAQPSSPSPSSPETESANPTTIPSAARPTRRKSTPAAPAAMPPSRGLIERANRLRASPRPAMRSAAARLVSRLTLAAGVPDPTERQAQLDAIAGALLELEAEAEAAASIR